MDSGCLIDINNLKVGDLVFDIIRGEGIVVEIEFKGKSGATAITNYPIECEFNSEGKISYTIDGKEFENHIYPSLYSKDPFKYAFNLVREEKLENIKLCQNIKRLETQQKEYLPVKDV
jgi:hypothetical protein